MQNISKHISYREATFSETGNRQGLENIPSEKVLQNMKETADAIFEPMREYFGVPIRVVSFFRSVAINKSVGGSPTSQHCTGEAMDIQGILGISNVALFHYIKDNLLFDQLIWEFGSSNDPAWVHVSYSKRNRKQVLQAKKVKEKTVYTPFK